MDELTHGFWGFVRGAFEDTFTSATNLGVFEEYAPPHTFAPRLSAREACIASAAAFVRILLGSTLFAVCGIGIWETWIAVSNVVLRFLLVLPETALFVAAMILLQAAISAGIRSRWPGVR